MAFAGDGDFMMSGHELATAVQYGAATGVEVILLEPIAERLPGDFELLGDLVAATSRAEEFDDLTPELRRVRMGASGHGGLFLRKAEGVHETEPASLPRKRALS